MAVPLIQTAFVQGEISPGLFGHVDLVKFHTSASTCRNLYVNYRGGAYSRAGTKFCGFSKQTGRDFPPRLIPFQFSINQGLALEFGDFYMRVVSDGAFVTEGAIVITGVSQANPAVVTTTGAFAAATATPVAGGILDTYAPGDTITLAGGIYITPAVLRVTNTNLSAVQINAPGSGYVPGDTVTMAGGTHSVAAIATVVTTQVVSATIANAGTTGTNGPATVTGTTGTGTPFQARVTIAGGIITAVNSISVSGSYTVNPTVPTAEPVTGAGLTGAQLNIAIGIATLTVTTPGVYTVNAPSGNFTQASTSGGGTGATFAFGLFGPNAVTVTTPGVYEVFPANPVGQASSSGVGLGATFNLTSSSVTPYNDGDWVYIAGVGGMTELNGNTYVIAGTTTTTLQLFDVYGNPVDSTIFGAYTFGGSVARIYTLPTPYAEEDLRWLKFTQSADVMSICCLNQDSLVEYAPQDLSRTSDTNWTFSPVVPLPTITPPASVTITASPSADHTSPDNGQHTNYAYVVTSVHPKDGSESVASPEGRIFDAVDIAAEAGTVTTTWTAVAEVNQYNVYKATPAYRTQQVPVGALFGYVGSSYGTQFADSNITADFSQVPPRHQDPFARGQVIGAPVVSGGSNYTTATATINTSTGSGAILEAVLLASAIGVVNSAFGGTSSPVQAIIVLDPGKDYLPSDTITITGDGHGATANLKVGALAGTYPSVPAYFQQRRFYGNSRNNPDTYWLSQPGSYTNFDYRIPTIPSDAFSGTPWSVQVNGIQFALSMPGGLVVLTGLSAWQLTGTGGSSLNPQPITAATQQAQPQAYNGCSSTVPPIKIDYDIIYVQAKGSIYRDLSYQFFTNIYTGVDLTQSSSQLFTGYTIREHAWCEEPFKVLWSVRDDGTMLSLTYLKPQEVVGWARHDTNGTFESTCSITEPPVDALYLGTQRFPGTNTAYMIERMDNRIWRTVEDCWCVDCGLSLGQPQPNATLRASSATGLGAITGVTGLVGGSGYSAGTTAAVVDDDGEGPGAGAVPTLTIVAGIITAVTFGAPGTGYVYPALVITDPANTGSGASAVLTLDNSMTFTATAAVFSAGNVGDVIRMGGGVATITACLDTTHVTAQITSPIVALRSNSGGQVQPQTAGSWTMTTPVTQISGLGHLAGMTVTGLADGNVIPPTVVSASGVINLPAPASAVTVGLGFQAQLQSVYLDAGEPTVQGQRKKIAAVTARVEASGNIKIGANQPDGSTLSPPQVAPVWPGMKAAATLAVPPYNSTTRPLFTGDIRIPVPGGYEKPGQVALQQDDPLPMQILAAIPEILAGDRPEIQATPRQRGRGQ